MSYKQVPINSIKINARIRKDLGDISSLAANIEEVGLLSPIIINEDNILLAGERRLEACRKLGMAEIPAIIKEVSEAEKELLVEISENEQRKSFSREELINAGIELERIEKVKAEERDARTRFGSNTGVENLPPPEKGKTRDIVATKLGMSGKQYEREKVIVQNKDLLSPKEYSDWNNRIASTNKTYNIINPPAPKQPKVVTEIKEVEVNPPDYDDIKAKVKKLEETNSALSKDYSAAMELLEETQPVDVSSYEAKIEKLEAEKADLEERLLQEQNNNSNIREDNARLQMSMTDISYGYYKTNKILKSLSRVESVAKEEFGNLIYGDLGEVDDILAKKIEKTAGNIIAMTKDLIMRLHTSDISEVVI